MLLNMAHLLVLSTSIIVCIITTTLATSSTTCCSKCVTDHDQLQVINVTETALPTCQYEGASCLTLNELVSSDSEVCTTQILIHRGTYTVKYGSQTSSITACHLVVRGEPNALLIWLKIRNDSCGITSHCDVSYRLTVIDSGDHYSEFNCTTIPDSIINS